jgi:hypothetical protein
MDMRNEQAYINTTHGDGDVSKPAVGSKRECQAPSIHVRTVPVMTGESENEAEAGPVGRRVSTHVMKLSGKVFGSEWCN